MRKILSVGDKLFFLAIYSSSLIFILRTAYSGEVWTRSLPLMTLVASFFLIGLVPAVKFAKNLYWIMQDLSNYRRNIDELYEEDRLEYLSSRRLSKKDLIFTVLTIVVLAINRFFNLYPVPVSVYFLLGGLAGLLIILEFYLHLKYKK